MQNKINKNTKKLIILISIIIIFFIFFLYMYFSPRSYEVKYKLNKIDVLENYNEEKSYYYFKFSYKSKDFEFVTQDDYTTKRKLIKEIKIREKDNILCIIPKSNEITTYPLCYKEDVQIDYNLADLDLAGYDKKIELTEKQYKDINVNYFNDKTYLIWDYNGFIYLNNYEQKKIKFLNKDIYNLDLVARVNNYLLIPDYNQEHSFNKIYLIDINKGKLKEWELEYEIYFDSYILGTHDKSIFLFDKKNEVEYELRPDKQKLRKIKYKTLVNEKWQSTTLAKLKNQVKFTEKKVYNFEVINNKLYLSYIKGNNKELISNQKITDIIYVDNSNVYYLVEDKLYMYNKIYGEVLLMSYFEWNFNYKNMIYIY